LYRAKAERRSAMRFFEPKMDRHIHEHERMERELRAALAADEVRPVFEPSKALESGRLLGFEAIPRWIHAEWGEVPPPRFIATAEQCGLVHELAERLLHHACNAARQWPPDIRLAVDLLPGQLTDQCLPARILETLTVHSIAPSRLEVEVTESAVVQDVAAAETILDALHAAGVRITLDHFGAGYSTLYHLRKCKLDKVKIDPVFVTGMGSEREKARLVSGLVGLGQGLGLVVAASGIVSQGDSASLLFSGCHEGQGDWVGIPASADSTLRLFAVPARSPQRDAWTNS
jgi:EAL domain-containing protein (putative c-di-GMP-specific phosphodiesterase class I)